MSHRRYKSNYDGKIAGLYDLEQTIGKGHFAVVKLARHVFTGEKVAVKVIDKTKLDETSRGHLFQEVRCMKLVQHPNVVRLYQVIDTQTKLYLILELGDGGDMYDYIMKHDRGLSEDVARLYFRQIVQAISYCHQLHVVHRDLKPENVVFFEKSGIVKLTDFGFSNKFIPGSKLETSCGSLAYSAPEILLGDLYDAPAVDVWSLGVILYMLVCGKAPFQEANDSETLTMIMDCKYYLPSSVTAECQHLINLMLVREPHERASLHDIMNHPWVTLGNPSSVPLGPLISRESLSEGDHSYVIQRMVDGKIASKEDILSSLEKDSYNNVTATYYLLAERLLRSQRDCHSNTPNQQKKHTADADNSKPLLSPLALSPRVQSADVSKADKQRKNISSLVSPPGARAGGSGRQVAVGGRSPSPVDRALGVMRRCSLIQEESFDEDEEDMEVEPAPETSSGRKDTSHQLRYSRSVDDGSFSDDSDTHSGSAAELNESPSRVTTRRRAPPIRPLHSVRSSPQLLNQIHEEGEESEGDEIYAPRVSPNRERIMTSMASPEVLRKYEHSHRRRRTPGSRGTSCSSSDASDTDETDPSRKRRRDKLRHRFQRRDSSDHSSDTDGPGGPGGLGGGNRPFNGGTGKDKRRERHHRGENDENKHAHKDSKGGKSGGGGGRQNGSLLGKRESNSTDNSQLEVDRKISNISITSNLSNLSLTSLNSRGTKYKMDTPTDSPKSSEDVNKDVESMNEENKARTRIIHVRSKEFSDLVDRFSTSGEEKVSYHPDKPKMRRRPKDKMKMDINRNGLITRTQCTLSDSDVKRPFEAQQINKTKCCSVV